jgi:hypothetical protein
MNEGLNCDACGAPEKEHAERAINHMTTIIMMRQAADLLPPDYAETLENVMYEWRTHTLPTCDPNAVK